MPRTPFFARLPQATVREIKRRAKLGKISEPAVIEDAVVRDTTARMHVKPFTPGREDPQWKEQMTTILQRHLGGPRRKARGGK